jgi:endonuclease YncB( thermonuclease family)
MTKEGRNDVMTYKRNYGVTLFTIFLFLAWSAAAFADFSGKVVAVKDGDTLEVMKEGVAVRVRLYGIDCPKKGQAFGQRAKKFASDLAFGKTVKVIEKDREKDWGSNLYGLLPK